MKKNAILLLLTCFLGYGADITPGYTFANGEQNITHSKLNSATAGTIATTFYSGKTAKATPADGDYFLMLDNAVSPAAYKRITWKGLYTNLLTEAWSSNAVDTADWLLFYDGTTYYKGLASHLLTNVYPTVTSNTLPTEDAFLVAIISNQWVKVGVTNVGWESKANLANLSEQASPTNTVKFFVSDGNSNSVMSATNLVGGWAASTNAVADTDQMLIYQAASNNLAKISLSAVREYVTNGASGFSLSQTNFTLAVPGNGAFVTNAHGLSSVPTVFDVRLVCTNTDANFNAGEEIPAHSAWCAAGDYVTPAFFMVADGTNVVVGKRNTVGVTYSEIYVLDRTGQLQAQIDPSKWNLKVRAIYIP